MAVWQRMLQVDWSLFSTAAAAWSNQNAQRMGAALAYYTILSLAPLLLVFAGISGLVFGQSAVSGDLYWQLQAVAGDQTATVVQNLLRDAHAHPKSGVITSIVAFLMLMLGASGVFIELRDDLNYIWDVPPPQESALRGMVQYRLFSFALVLGSGFLITCSMAVSVAVQAAEKYLVEHVSISAAALEAANFTGTFFATTFLFGLIYTIFPDRRVPWRDVTVGAVVTAALFTAGKSLVGLFVGKAGVGSLYGAAGSLVVLLVWIYYSSQIFLFGAEFTHIYSQRHGILSRETVPGRVDTEHAPGIG
jgi:membrane protein